MDADRRTLLVLVGVDDVPAVLIGQGDRPLPGVPCPGPATNITMTFGSGLPSRVTTPLTGRALVHWNTRTRAVRTGPPSRRSPRVQAPRGAIGMRVIRG